mmetsp:Transcript_17829/g.12782  ORF Transcript_17829/g.12782 Transcript_17829/m.12782 type:complete len:151 (+) Transcript_17829:463-915(+)
MREEYIFVFCGFNERFLNSVEVFDVTRGIWREFPGAVSARTKFQAVQVGPEQILLLGGKDEFGVPTDEVDEFNIKDMRSFPADWRLPSCLSGFSACMIKPGVMAVCGGSDGKQILNKFFLVSFKGKDPMITDMPPMINSREEFQLLVGPD